MSHPNPLSSFKAQSNQEIEIGQLQRAIYEHSPLGIAFSAPRGKILGVNQKFCDLLGYTEQELLRMNFSNLTHPDFWEKEVHIFRETLNSGGDSCRIEKAYLHKAGHHVWVDVSMSLVRSKDTGKLDCVIAMINNISAQVEMAQALKQSEEALRTQNTILEAKVQERTQELAIQNEKLQASNQELEAFAYAASHDLKEPIRTISSFASLLKRRHSDRLGESGNHYLNYIIDGANRMIKLIGSILDYSVLTEQVEKGGLVNIKTVIKNIEKDLAYLLKEKNGQLHLENLPTAIFCNPEQISVVFFNLISNALKFNQGESTKVFISATEEEEQWIFSVKDNGLGIAPEYQDQIFGLFKRLHNHEEYEGSGIGLSMCQKIIQSHGGYIWVNSQVNVGTTFSFSIPKSIPSPKA